MDGGAANAVAWLSQVLVAFCLHQNARLDVCIQSPSSCLCHVAVRDRFAGPSSSVLYWSGSERSDTLSKRLRVILYVLVTRSNTSLVPPAPESRYLGALCEGSLTVQFCIQCHTVM